MTVDYLRKKYYRLNSALHLPNGQIYGKKKIAEFIEHWVHFDLVLLCQNRVKRYEFEFEKDSTKVKYDEN